MSRNALREWSPQTTEQISSPGSPRSAGDSERAGEHQPAQTEEQQNAARADSTSPARAQASLVDASHQDWPRRGQEGFRVPKYVDYSKRDKSQLRKDLLNADAVLEKLKNAAAEKHEEPDTAVISTQHVAEVVAGRWVKVKEAVTFACGEENAPGKVPEGALGKVLENYKDGAACVDFEGLGKKCILKEPLLAKSLLSEEDVLTELERTWRAEHKEIMLALRKKVFVHEGIEAGPGGLEEEKLWEEFRKLASKLSIHARDEDMKIENLKARHMHEMVEEMDDGRKILFLTNAQAQVVASSEETMNRMVCALGLLEDGPEAPKLVINLLNSAGLSNERNGAWTWTKDEGPRTGPQRRKAPFLHEEDDRRAEERLDCFMSEVLIPLAVRTNAIVIIHPFTSQCALSQSFQRMVQLQRGKWPRGQAPFKTVTMTNLLFLLHMNPDENAEWLKIRNQCTAWKRRSSAIKQAFQLHAAEDSWFGMTALNVDLNKNSSIVIVVDNIDDRAPESLKQDTRPFDDLNVKFWQTLTTSLPRVAIQTGVPDGSQNAELPGLSPTIGFVQSKTPLIFLDLRERVSAKAGVCLDSAQGRAGRAAGAAYDPGPVGGVQARGRRGAQDLGAPGGGDPQGQGVGEVRADAAQSGWRASMISKANPGGGDPQGQGVGEVQADAAQSGGRASMISKAKHDFEEFLEALGKVKNGMPVSEGSNPIMLWDHLICCNISWFLNVLMHDGDPSTTELGTGKLSRHQGPGIPMHKAIAQAQLEAQTGNGAPWRVSGQGRLATLEEVNDVSFLLADRFYQGIWRVKTANRRPDIGADTAVIDHTGMYKDSILEMSNQIRTLLTSPHLSFLNVHGPLEVAETLVRQIVRLDRLPTKNSLQGLLLLHDAWCEYDIVMHRADSYRRLNKVFFTLQLVVSWLIVVAGTINSKINDPKYSTWTFLVSSQHALPKIVFGLSIFVTLLISIDTLLNSKARWRHLRSSAGSLKSLLFQYRTRVGQFGLDVTNSESQKPEVELCAALVKWRTDLVAGGDLQLSDLRRNYPPKVFRHQQFDSERVVMADDTSFKKRAMKTKQGKMRRKAEEARMERTFRREQTEDSLEDEARGDGDVGTNTTQQGKGKEVPLRDDSYCPMLPEQYIEIRLEEMLAFYQLRIPQYARASFQLKVFLVLLAGSASVLSAENLTEWALIVTSAAAMITSYMEFSDVARKTERYTRSAVELENLLSYWKSLPDAEKASTSSIDHLVLTGEAIISEELVAWVSTAQKSSQGNKDGQALSNEGSTANLGRNHSQGMNERESAQVVRSGSRRVQPI